MCIYTYFKKETKICGLW